MVGLLFLSELLSEWRLCLCVLRDRRHVPARVMLLASGRESRLLCWVAPPGPPPPEVSTLWPPDWGRCEWPVPRIRSTTGFLLVSLVARHIGYRAGQMEPNVPHRCGGQIGPQAGSRRLAGRIGPLSVTATRSHHRWAPRRPLRLRTSSISRSAPTMAVIQVLALKNVLSVWTWKSFSAMTPPRTAPTIPTTDATRMPVRSPVKDPAMLPAMAPNTIQAMMPTWSPFAT